MTQSGHDPFAKHVDSFELPIVMYVQKRARARRMIDGLRAPMIGAVAIFLVGTAPTRSAGDIIQPCRMLPDGVTVIYRLDDVPPSIAQALAGRLGEVASAGEMFNETDVMATKKNHRLIFVWHLGSRWVVAIEHGGGFVRNNLVYTFEVGEQQAVLVEEGEAIAGSLCATASKNLLATAPAQSLPATK